MLPVQLGDSLLFLTPNPMYWDIFSSLKPYPERGISLGLRPGARAFSIPPATPPPAASVICLLLASSGSISQKYLIFPLNCVLWEHFISSKLLTVTFPSGRGLPILSTLLCSPGFSEDPRNPQARLHRIMLLCHPHSISSKKYYEKNALTILGFLEIAMTGTYLWFHNEDIFAEENTHSLSMHFLFYSFCFYCPKIVIHPQGPTEYFYSWYEMPF